MGGDGEEKKEGGDEKEGKENYLGTNRTSSGLMRTRTCSEMDGGIMEGKLTEDAVKVMLLLKKQGKLNVRQWAEHYKVAAETIRRAVRGETWGYLQPGWKGKKENSNG